MLRSNEPLMKARPGLLLLLVLLSLRTCVPAQEPPTQTQGGPAVRLNLIALDHSQHAYDELTKDSITVLEDKVPQTISVFAKDERSVSYGIAIDNSGSFRALMGPSIDAAKILIDANRATDETLLVRFVSSDKVATVQDFTADKAQLTDSLKKLKVENGQSAVIDAIYVSVKAVAAHRASDPAVRRALILVSDGEDRASYYTLDQLLQLLRSTEVQVFIIGLVNDLDNQQGLIRLSPRARAEQLLQTVARESGGQVFFPGNVTEISGAAVQVSHLLQTQYVIDYRSTNGNSKDNYRKVTVKIAEAPGRAKLSAVVRPGYFLTPPEIKSRGKE
jgi:Ca-activated chloride channel family protein